jgi:hypothetical protein
MPFSGLACPSSGYIGQDNLRFSQYITYYLPVALHLLTLPVVPCRHFPFLLTVYARVIIFGLMPDWHNKIQLQTNVLQ